MKSSGNAAARRLARVLLVLAVVSGGGSACSADSRSSTSTSSRAPTATSSPLEAASCLHDEKTFRCVKYVRNYDADTITVDIPGVHPLIGEHISVRIQGIDAPEVRTDDECEKRSARIARKLVENQLKRAKRIDLVDVDRDKYFRILAEVRVDGRDLKEILIKNGLAYEYHGGTKQKIDWCKSASGEARIPSDSP